MTEDQQEKSPLREITQPFIDLVHAPRALWGINLAYVLEGMVYFGMLGYLAIYFSDFIFQGVEHADEHSHNNVMVLTAGITIAMFFLGSVADKWGVRFALIAAFVFMLFGRAFMAGAPNVLGFDPPRPGVFAGDMVSLHVTGIETRDGIKAITKATVIANDLAGVETDAPLDLAAGEGIAPGEQLEGRLVRLSHATLLEGEAQEWTVRYGREPVTAKLFIHSAEQLGLRAGATIALRRAYVTKRKKKKETDLGVLGVISAWFGDEDTLPQGLKRENEDEFLIGFNDDGTLPKKTEKEEYEFIIRSHWLEDVAAIDTFPVDLAAGEGIVPGASLESVLVRLSEARLVKGEGQNWRVLYGSKPVIGRWFNRSPEELGLCDGATFSLNQARVTKGEGKVAFTLRFDWRKDMGIVDLSGCAQAPDRARGLRGQVALDLAAGEGTVPDGALRDKKVRLSEATLVRGDGLEWQIQYGRKGVTTQLVIESVRDVGVCPGARISLQRANVIDRGAEGKGLALRARWPEDIAAIDTRDCAQPPYRTIESKHEEMLRSTSRWPVAEPSESAREANLVGVAELRKLPDGPVNVVLRDAHVTYVRNGGYFLQTKKDGPAIFAAVDPFGSTLQLVTLLGILLVVIGYGMYQPAAYAAVRQFTTPKTAAMGFAMLYALMNLGGWLPTFAFLVRDEKFLGLGIPGTYWVYTGFTLLALLVTLVILSKRTVATAIQQAKEETAAIEAAEGTQKKDDAAKEEHTAAMESGRAPMPPLHMWLLALVFLGTVYWKVGAPWNTQVCAFLAVLWTVLCFIPTTGRYLAKHPLADIKFFFFIFALIPVQTLFTYNWLILPQYISRAFEGWIGEYFEIASNANPLLIFIAVPVIAAATRKAKVYNMMIYGTFVMAAPAFLLALGPHAWTLFGYLLIMTIGEAMWQPRFLQYAAEIAPEGRTGQYMGVAQLPWFMTKMLVPWLYSGWAMDHFCPAEGVRNTELMWFYFGCIAITSTLLLIVAKGWVGKDFKTKAD